MIKILTMAALLRQSTRITAWYGTASFASGPIGSTGSFARASVDMASAVVQMKSENARPLHMKPMGR